MMKQRIWIAVSLFLLLSLALAGCGKPMTVEEIVAKIQETIESTQDAHALVAVDVNAQGLVMSATIEVWEKSPDKVHAVVLEASQSDLVGTTVVSDGQQAWYYEPSRNRVLVGAAGDMDTPLPQELLNGLQEVVQAVLATSDVELVGEEEVAGQPAYKLTASPQEGAASELFPGNGTATLWVDKERWIVLKATYEAGSFGQGTMEVRSFDLNPGLSDDLFTFVVPEGVAVVDVSAKEPVPMTLAEAQAEAGFPLLVPAYVPEGATLVEVFKVGDSFVLRYDHSTQVSFTVVQGPELAGLPSLGQSQDVGVRGQSATVVTDEAGGNTFLYWAESGGMVTVAGHISQAEALKVAESLE